jgi:hypothetical protein
MNTRGEQIGALFGIVFVALLFLGLRLLETQTSELSLVAIRVSMVAFLVFLGSLWSALSRGEGEHPWLSQVVFGSGVVFVAIIYTIDSASNGALGSGASANSWMALALMMLSAGIITIKSRVMPSWLGWAGVLLALPVWSPRMMGPDFVFLASALFGLWVLATSVALMWRRRAAPLSQKTTAAA